jgi:hypothetical protein
MTRRALLFTLFVLLPVVSVAQQGAASPIDGVWKITEITTTGANAATNKSPQPSLLIFARGHYSWINVNGTTARKQRAAAAAPGKLTDAEKIAAYDEWGPLTANAGTFAVKGSTLSRTILVAKNVGAMSATTPNVQQFKLDGNTLSLTGPAANDPKAQITYRLTRVR